MQVKTKRISCYTIVCTFLSQVMTILLFKFACENFFLGRIFSECTQKVLRFVGFKSLLLLRLVKNFGQSSKVEEFEKKKDTILWQMFKFVKYKLLVIKKFFFFQFSDELKKKKFLTNFFVEAISRFLVISKNSIFWKFDEF